MAFTDDDIRAIVETGKYSDPQSAKYIIDTLIDRRNKIGRAFFSKVLPLDHFRVENGELRFDDLAVQYGLHAPQQYEVRWFRFDNISRKHDSVGTSTSMRLPAEAAHAARGSYFTAVIDARDESRPRPISVYVRKEANGYKVVGVERTS